MLEVFGAAGLFFFLQRFTTRRNTPRSVFNEVSRPVSSWAQCSPVRRITRLPVFLSSSSRRAVANKQTPSAALWLICRIVPAGRCMPNGGWRGWSKSSYCRRVSKELGDFVLTILTVDCNFCLSFADCNPCFARWDKNVAQSSYLLPPLQNEFNRDDRNKNRNRMSTILVH